MCQTIYYLDLYYCHDTTASMVVYCKLTCVLLWHKYYYGQRGAHSQIRNKQIQLYTCCIIEQLMKVMILFRSAGWIWVQCECARRVCVRVWTRGIRAFLDRQPYMSSFEADFLILGVQYIMSNFHWPRMYRTSDGRFSCLGVRLAYTEWVRK